MTRISTHSITVVLAVLCGCATVDTPFDVFEESAGTEASTETPITADGFDPSLVLAVHTDEFGEQPGERFQRFIDSHDEDGQQSERFSEQSGSDTSKRQSEWPRTTFESTQSRRAARRLTVTPIPDVENTPDAERPAATETTETAVPDVQLSPAGLKSVSARPVADENRSDDSAAVEKEASIPNRVQQFDDLFPVNVSRRHRLGARESAEPLLMDGDDALHLNVDSRVRRETTPGSVSFLAPDGNEFVIETVVRWRKVASDSGGSFLDARSTQEACGTVTQVAHTESGQTPVCQIRESTQPGQAPLYRSDDLRSLPQ